MKTVRFELPLLRPTASAAGIVFLLITVMPYAGCQSEKQSNTNGKGVAANVLSFATGEAAVGILQAIGKAQTFYQTANGTSYGTFDQLSQQGYLPPDFKGERPVKNGYVFRMTMTNSAGGAPSFSATADPETGDGRHFFMDYTMIVRFNDKQAATVGDPTLRN